jgi:hypothetical protein
LATNFHGFITNIILTKGHRAECGLIEKQKRDRICLDFGGDRGYNGAVFVEGKTLGMEEKKMKRQAILLTRSTTSVHIKFNHF